MKKLAALLFVSGFLLTACASADYTDHLNRKYEDYQEFYIKEIQDEMFNKEEDKYCVYIFRRACGSCIDIKGAVLDYLDSYKLNSLEYKLYLYERNQGNELTPSDLIYFKGSIYGSNEVNKYINEMKGCSLTKDIYIYGTPSLYFIENNKFSNYLYLTNDIASFLYKNK